MAAAPGPAASSFPDPLVLVKPGSLVDRKEAERIERLTLALSTKAPPWAAEYLKKAAPIIGIFTAGAEVVGPKVVAFYVAVWRLYKKLPTRAVNGLWGLSLCFYGGRYAVVIAAIEAFHQTGGGKVIQCLEELHEDVNKLIEANAEDDKKDEDGDGVADVEQMTNKQLMQRKTMLALRTINPDRVMTAAGGVYTGYMGVIVALRFEFAKTVALAHSIGDNLRPMAAKILAPPFLHITPPEYRHWVSPMINLGCKTAAMAIAWKIQQIISTFHSGVKGGLIVSRGLIDFVQEKKWIKFGTEDTIVDEVLGYGLAGGGIYFQLIKGGPMPFFMFPFSWPMSILERWLQWAVTYGATPEGATPALK